MKNPKLNILSALPFGIRTQLPDEVKIKPGTRPSILTKSPLLAGALLAIATLSIPSYSLAQTAKKEQIETRKGNDREDLRISMGSKNNVALSTTKDFKLGGPEEPDFPPPSAHLSRGTLHVQGTQARDLIEIEITGEWVEVWISDFTNPTAPIEIFFDTFHSSEVNELRLFGLAGRDTIINETSFPDFIWGGLGNDDILAGDGVSHVYGQDGDDILSGNGGDDYLWGGEGDDFLFGGPGSDLVSGENGVDWVSGGDSYGVSDDEFDQLVGGADGDIFTVPPAHLAEDVLFDYDPNEGDQLLE